MGVLPLQFKDGDNAESLGITGQEVFDVTGISRMTNDNQPRPTLSVTAHKPDGSEISFDAVARLDSKIEVEYYRNGGILHTFLRGLLK